MKRRHLLALLGGISLAVPAVAAAQAFEGTWKQQHVVLMPQAVAELAGAGAGDPQKILELVTQRVQSATPMFVKTENWTVSVKGRKTRVDGLTAALDSQAYAISDGPSAALDLVIPSQRMIFAMHASDTTAIAQARRQVGLATQLAPESPPVVVDLGTRTIEGVEAHGYRVTAAVGVGEVWVDPARRDLLDLWTGMDRLTNAFNPEVAPLLSAMQALGFALLTRYVIKPPPPTWGDWLYNEWRISDVEQHPVPDDVFLLPGFRRLTFTELLGGRR